MPRVECAQVASIADTDRVILPKIRDPRLVTTRRGGTLTEADHKLLALWAAACAEHVLPMFESERPDDPRPRRAIEAIRAWTRGDVKMMQARAAGGHAMAAARELRGAPRLAAFAAGQAAAVAHVAEHELGAAAYAIKAACAAVPKQEAEAARLGECRWQREQLPLAVGSWCSRTSSGATTCAGPCSTADLLARAGSERPLLPLSAACRHLHQVLLCST